jgi:hypothetical protein
MWIANGRTTTSLLFLDSLFPKTARNAKYFFWRQNNQKVKYSPI